MVVNKSAALDCLLALGPKGAYIYRTPTKLMWGNVPKPVEEALSSAKSIQWAAFGDNVHSYFLCYTLGNENIMLRGGNLPPLLDAWLVDPEKKVLRRSPATRVTLGPNGSFVAWDGDNIRWHNIPPGLEEKLQEWSGPGKKPHLVCLGQNESYLATTTHGGWKLHNLPPAMLAELYKSKNKIGQVMCAALSSVDDRYVAIAHDNNSFGYSVPKGDGGEGEENLCSTLEPLIYGISAALSMKVNRMEKKIRQIQKEQDAASKEKGRTSIKDRLAREAAEKLAARDAAERKRMKEVRLQHKRDTFVNWKKQCEVYFKARNRTVFVYPPPSVCLCKLPSCTVRKSQEKSIGACIHDIERLLRGSDQYSLKFLRAERLRWHPDKFGQGCESAQRAELAQKATQMFTIFEELIAAET